MATSIQITKQDVRNEDALFGLGDKLPCQSKRMHRDSQILFQENACTLHYKTIYTWTVQQFMILWWLICCWLCGIKVLLCTHFFFVHFAQELMTNHFLLLLPLPLGLLLLLLLLLHFLLVPWERMSSYSIITIINIIVTYYSCICKSFLHVNCWAMLGLFCLFLFQMHHIIFQTQVLHLM